MTLAFTLFVLIIYGFFYFFFSPQNRTILKKCFICYQFLFFYYYQSGNDGYRYSSTNQPRYQPSLRVNRTTIVRYLTLDWIRVFLFLLFFIISFIVFYTVLLYRTMMKHTLITYYINRHYIESKYLNNLSELSSNVNLPGLRSQFKILNNNKKKK